MQTGKAVQIYCSLRHRKWLVLLVAAHLPFLLKYLSSLWQQQHYQFFPFAIGAFVWLLVTRRSSEPERWTLPAKMLIGIDLVCLSAGYFLNSPWLVVLGLVAGLMALCFANRDAGYNRRCTYLALLPLLVVRLPLQYDLQVINWLQRVTTAVASTMLHRIGTLHFRDGNVLQLPGKSFMVAEACSGVQSLFTILFIAALVICLKRRSLIHGAVLLASGVMFAGVMNTLRVIAIAVAWDRYSTDLSSGVFHDVLGYMCLALAAAMLMSADAFLGFVTDPVHDRSRHAKLLNPLILIWNRILTVVPAGRSREIQTEANPERRHHPSVSDFFKLRNLVRFVLGLAVSWWFSRTYRHLVSGLPFVTATVGGILLGFWLKHASDTPVIDRYESAFNAAVQSNDVLRQDTCLQALVSLRSTVSAYRFRLAQFMLREGRQNEGLNEILRLTPETSSGFAEARIWLVKQALQPNALKPLSRDEIEQQLITVLIQIPNHIEAHQLLAQLYVERKEWKLAEQHLTEVASIQPEQNLALAKLKKALNRSPEDVRAVARRAVETLVKQLEADRMNATVRAALAEACMIAGNDKEAREVLVSGLQQNDDPLLRKALSDYDLFEVNRRMTQSPLNRDTCVPVVILSLERDPSNVIGIEMLTRLHTMGAQILPESLPTTLSYWQHAADTRPGDDAVQICLCRLLFAVGDSAKAAAVIRPVVAQKPELRLTLARLLMESGETSESTALLQTLINESRTTFADNAKDPAAAAEIADAQLLLGLSDDARSFLATFAEDPATSHIPADAGLAALYGRACIQCYDKLTDAKGDAQNLINSIPAAPADNVEPEALLQLLADAVRCGFTANQAIDRIAVLSLSSHPAAQDAEAMVRQLRLEGTHGAQALNQLGMHALIVNRFDKARLWLEQANAQTHGQDPMVLNNLATAIIRGGGDTNDRALQLVNETLVILPDHPDVLATRGEIYIAMKRWTDAIADLTESVKLRSNSIEVHRLLEKAYTGLPDLEMAEKHRQCASELERSGPNFVKSF